MSDIKAARSLFKRAIGHIYQQVVLQSFTVPATKTELKKVTNMVGTFFNESNTGRLFKKAIGYTHQHFVKVSTTKSKPEKVTSMVGTFFNKDRTEASLKEQLAIYQQVVKVAATNTELKKVTNMVGTFFNEGNTGSLFKKAIGYTHQHSESS